MRPDHATPFTIARTMRKDGMSIAEIRRRLISITDDKWARDSVLRFVELFDTAEQEAAHASDEA